MPLTNSGELTNLGQQRLALARLPSEAGSIVGLAVFANDGLRIAIDGRAEQVMGQVAKGNYFELVGVKPVMRRLRNPADGPSSPIAVITDIGSEGSAAMLE